MKPITSKIDSEAAQLAELEKQIALAASQPELVERRRKARSEVSMHFDKSQRTAIEVTRYASILADEKSISEQVAASVQAVRFGLDRLTAAAEGSSHIQAIDNAIIASEYLSRTSAAKILSRAVALERAKKLADISSGSHKLALADLQNVDNELAAITASVESQFN